MDANNSSSMDIDKELIEDTLKDMKMVHEYLIYIKKLGVPVFVQAAMLNLRIIELEDALK